MRTFRDSDGEQWTVLEVRRQVDSGTKGGDLSYLPSGFNAGWLCFENPSAKKRLTRYPTNWRELSDVQLETLLEEAAPAPRASLRLTDLGESSTTPNVTSD